jgi:hypothetical protein
MEDYLVARLNHAVARAAIKVELNESVVDGDDHEIAVEVFAFSAQQ